MSYVIKQPLKMDHTDLFERYYHVRFKHLDSRTPEQIRRTGVRISGVPEIDRDASKYEVDSELTIDQMFELWRNGATVKLVNYDDSAEIYQIIQRHIVRTAEAVKYAINGVSRELLVDMVDLDKFASVVYSKASSIFTDMERKAIHSHTVAGLPQINALNILGSSGSKVTSIRQGADGKEIIERERMPSRKEAPIRERTAMAEDFAERIERIGGIGALNGNQAK